jgi:4-amino-4-deoxy-L-arabinose transferase-like glycosyltransferase
MTTGGKVKLMKKRTPFGYLFLLLILLALFGGLGIMDLRGEEPRRALVAWEMIRQANYLQPTIQGLPYYNKPPVFNWVVAVFFQ